MKTKIEVNYFWKMVCMIAAFVLIFCVSFFLGRYGLTPAELVSVFASKIFPGVESLVETQVESLIFNVRLPRILMAPLIGCCLAMAGVCYQGIFQNPMASPDFLGASSGAALGAALAIILDKNAATITSFAFVFGMGTVILVIFISQRMPGSRVTSMILAGVIISSLCSSGSSYLKLVADPDQQLPEITYWLMGTIAKTRLDDVWHALIPMLIGIIPLIFLSWKMNLLTLGDEEAQSMGINVNRVRVIVILCSTLITAASVSYCGTIGWVGLVIPHFARRVVGNNYNRLLPSTMLIGAAFMLLVDNIARTLLKTELPLGILTAIIGAPFFIYLVTRKEEVL